MNNLLQKPTPAAGIAYFTPPADYQLSGRDGMVAITWNDRPPIPLLDEDFVFLEGVEVPDYDMVGRGIYQLLRLDPDCTGADVYAGILKDAYPHIISELGGQIIMLEAKEVDTPYLDRKINFLKIMALLDPYNAGLLLEIGRAYIEKGSTLSNMQYAVTSWYAAEKNLKRARELNPDDRHAAYEYGEALYILGRYHQAVEVWSELLPLLESAERLKVEARVGRILAGKTPKVPPLDYLTALSVAVEQHYSGFSDNAAAIIEDVLTDQIFVEQFPMNEVYFLLGTCYQETGLMDEAAEAFKRS
ncbi:MAG: tetratricopeptide repeat protein [Desulfuromonadaceae bacterium]|nr:tetratricopeptide repeat protein [Desulfuromonadaceae bacterium]MDD5104126.1 tetratricopeptide repeat protein [Desulfuromonadaceae bacterium]